MIEWEPLVAESQSRIKNHLQRRGVSPEDIEDVTQEAYLRLLESPKEIDRPLGWVVVTARNAAIDLQRKNRREVELNRLHPTGANTEDEAITNVFMEEVLSLAPECVVFQAEGYQDSEIANHFGINRQTVRQRIHRGRIALRQQFIEGGEPI